jgi:hypothetical protein
MLLLREKRHKSPACRLRNRPKQEWAINKTSENIQAQNVMTSLSSQEGRSDNNATTSITSTSTSIMLRIRGQVLK